MIARVRLTSNKTTRCRACRLPLIIRLYETRNDHLPEPSRRSDASSGFVHQTVAHVVCPTCEGVDSFACTGCGGRGEVSVKRERDPYSVDHVPAAGTATIKLGHEPSRDAELVRLAGQTRAPWASVDDELEDANLHGYGWERARAQMFARFDYHALNVAIDQLLIAHPGVPAMSPYGLVFIDAKMPDRIRAPRVTVAPASIPAKGSAAGDKALKDRDRLVLDLAAKNIPYDEIAKTVGLSGRQLRRVINERGSEAA